MPLRRHRPACPPVGSVLRRLAPLGLSALLGACASLSPRVEMGDTGPVRPVPVPLAEAPSPTALPAAAPSGSLYAAGRHRPLFEDHRARLVGDTLQIRIVEKISASASSSSAIDKTGELKAGVSALPFLSASRLAKASAEGSSSNTFSGNGTTQSANDFTGTITASVVEVLPNGHLLVRGEKQIGVNDAVDVLRFTGQVDPRSIVPGNAVDSSAVANVRLEHRGRGAAADAQVIGWLGRFFLSVLPL